MPISDLTNALKTAALTIEQITDIAIAGDAGLKSIAGSEVGGYLDQITKIIKDLKDPKNAGNAEFQYQANKSLHEVENLLRMFDGSLNLDAFETRVRKALNDALDKRQQKAATKPGPGVASGGVGAIHGGILITVQNGRPYVDVLNDTGSFEQMRQQLLQRLIASGQVSGG